MFQPNDGLGDWGYGPRADPDHLFEKWLREQMRRRMEMEMQWEQEAAERDVAEYRYQRYSAGGLISSIINCMVFIPLQYRRIVCRLESMLWQVMLQIVPDIVWAVLLSCAFGVLVICGPVISWSSPTYWTVLQAFVDMCLVYFVVRRILIRVFVDWKFRRRLKWWAAQGYIDAQYSLGSMYEAGDGIPTDARLAAHWYHKAAQNGHCDAQYSLGECYFKGYGVPVNLREARKWYQRAANQGDVDAEMMEDYIKKLIECGDQTGDGGGKAAARRGGPPVRQLPSPENYAQPRSPGEEEEMQRKQKKNRQREYEQMEAQRKQQAVEKRKAKAERQRKEKQAKEKAEQEAVRQAAELARLVEEERRQRVRSEVHEQKAIKGGKKDSSSRGCTNTSSNASNAAFLKEEQAQKPKARFPRGADEKAQRSPSETSNSSLRSGDSSPRSPKQTGVPKQYSSSQSRASPETKRHVGSSPGSSVRTVATQPYAPRMGGIRRAEEVSAAQLEKAAATEESPKSSGASDAVRPGTSYRKAAGDPSRTLSWSCDGRLSSEVQQSPPHMQPGFSKPILTHPIPPPPPPASPPPQNHLSPSKQSPGIEEGCDPGIQPQVASPSIAHWNFSQHGVLLDDDLGESIDGGQAGGVWGAQQWASSDTPWSFQMHAQGHFSDGVGGDWSAGMGMEQSEAVTGQFTSVDQQPCGATSAQLSEVAAHYLRRLDGSPRQAAPTVSPFTPQAMNGGSMIWDNNYGMSDSDGNVCVVCLEREQGLVAMLPCRHTHCCVPCAHALFAKGAPCPICRSSIEDLKPVKL